MRHLSLGRMYKAVLLLSLSMAVPSAFALKVGEPQVKSYMGQPLLVEFPIEESTPEEMERLQVALGRPELFSSMRSPYHPSLKTSTIVVEGAPLRPKVVLRTEGPVDDSVVDVVFELMWAAGRMVQTHAVLLDPSPTRLETPVVAPLARPVLPVASPVSPSPTATTAVQVFPDKTGLGPVPKNIRKKNNHNEIESISKSEQTLTIQPGDTLGKIARTLAPEYPQLTLEQLIVALQERNKKSVKNVHRIYAGTTLQLPSGDVTRVSQKEAVSRIHAQAGNFHQYRQQLAHSARAAKTSVADASKATHKGTTQTQAAVPAPEKSLDHVTVATAETAPSKKGQARTPKSNATERRAQLQAEKIENLEREKLIAQQLQAIQDLKKEKPPAVPVVTQDPSPSAPVLAPVEQLKQKEAEQAAAKLASTDSVIKPVEFTPSMHTPVSSAGMPTNESSNPAKSGGGVLQDPTISPAEVKEVAPPIAKKPAASTAHTTPVKTPPPAEKSLVDDLIGFVQENTLWIGSLGIALLGSLGAAVWWRRKRQDDMEADFTESAIVQEPVVVKPVERPVESYQESRLEFDTMPPHEPDDAYINTLAITPHRIEDIAVKHSPNTFEMSLSNNPEEQLKLAAFYVNLNDAQGAKELLEPLLAHPDVQIRTQARELYDQAQ